MKKRILSALLLLATFLSVIPMQTVMAEEVLPKDETPGVTQTPTEEESLLTAYDKLYVGADGSATANGGHLIGLYTAYGSDTKTVTVSSGETSGTWKNKMDATGATDAVLRDTYDGVDWALQAGGGVGYHMNAEQWSAAVFKIGITMPEAWAALPNFTVEQTAVLDAISHTSKLASNHSAVRLDLLLGLWMPSVSKLDGGENYCWRWRTGVFQGWANNLMTEPEYAHRDAYIANGNKAVGIVSSFDKITTGKGVSFYVSHNAGGSYGGLSYTREAYALVDKNEAYNGTDKGNLLPLFSVMNDVPGTIYSLRVYDAALTVTEKNHNAVVDIMAANEIDPTDYMALPLSVRNMIATVLSVQTLAIDKEYFVATLEEWAALFEQPVSLEDSLYVTEGLTLFTVAFQAMNSGSFDGTDGVNWINMVDGSANLNLRGEGWTAGANGGFTIVKDYEGFKQDRNFGMILPGSVLPREDYTVEFVYNPTGVTTTGENGELEHYRHVSQVEEKNGLYTRDDDGIVIGPLRALQFASYRAIGTGGQMERRWHYHATRIWLDVQVKDYYETAWAELGIHQIVTYGIVHDYDEGAAYYEMFNDLNKVMSMDVAAKDYKTPDEAKNVFKLLVGVAGTAYAVRVYDRVLTKSEMAQNHVADIFYYYGLDPALLDVRGMEKSAGLIYNAFSDIGFDLTREEAEAQVIKKMAAIWLSYEGIGIRKDGTDGLRYYFHVTEEAVTAMSAAGVRVEMGALINIGKNVAPLLSGDAYDYKIVGYDSVAGRNRPFFVDDETFAVTVRYENTDKAVSLSEINVCGYVKLIYEDGSEAVHYIDASMGSGIENTLFGIYDKLKDVPAIKEDSLLLSQMKERMTACYENVIVHVQAGAAAGGDGSKEKPYHSFAQGFAKSKELLAKVGKPTSVTLLLGDGEYGIYEKQVLKDTDMPYPYTRFEITSENQNSILTTTKTISEQFTAYADNVWFCQLEKENGAYPSFRYLYVDGVMADLSYSGARYSYDEEDHFVTAFERDYDGPWAECNALYETGTLTKTSESTYPADRPDLIASFENYKTQFLALMEMERLYRARALAIDTRPTDFSDSLYLSAFEDLKLWRLALDDLKAQNAEKNAGKNYNDSLKDFKKFEPSATYAGNQAYKEKFDSLKAKIEELSTVSLVFEAVEPTVLTTAQAEGKHYMPLEMVGDLTAALEEGKTQAKAKFEAIKAAYDAADTAGKAAMQAEYDAAALRASDESRYRYALEGKGFELHHAGQWWYNIVHVTGVDYGDTVKDEEGNTHVAVFFDLEEYAYYQVHKLYTMVGRYVHMKNALDYVDSEGEYFYDETTGKLYYYSESGVKDKVFSRATSDYMLWFDSVEGVTVSNLEFTGVDDNYLSHNHGCYGLGGVVAKDTSLYYDRSAIRLENCYGLTIMDCNFHDLGVRAIHGDGKLEGIRIESNTFTRLGAGAIHFGAAEEEREWNYKFNYIEDVVITENYLYDISREYYNDAAIWLHYGKDVDITYNTIERCSYSGISVGWTFTIPTWTPGARYHIYNVNIAYNFVTEFMHEIGDGAGIYVAGGNAPIDWTEYFNYVHDNFVLLSNQTGNGLGHMLVGIYFDGSSSNWLCSNNVVTEQSYGAVAGEDDALFAAKDPYVVALRNRFNGSTFIFHQHLEVQITHNILCDGNYILNVRAKTPEAQKLEVYKTYLNNGRNVKEKNTQYVVGVDRIPALAQDIIAAAGCYGHTGDPSVLYTNNY